MPPARRPSPSARRPDPRRSRRRTHLPYAVRELAMGTCSMPATWRCTSSRRPARARTMSPSSPRPAIAVIAGDLDGVRGARSIPGPPDDAAWAASRGNASAVAPAAAGCRAIRRVGEPVDVADVTGRCVGWTDRDRPAARSTACPGEEPRPRICPDR